MSRLDLAEERLAQALEKLEKAAESRARHEDRAPATDVMGEERDRLHARIAQLEEELAAGASRVSQIDAMAEERSRLLTRIAQLEEELAAISSASQEVEGRLDGAIGEIRAALAR